MASAETLKLKEFQPLTDTEKEIYSKLESDIPTLHFLSETLIFQCIRGWETEENRYDATRENIKRIIAFRQKARCTELLSEPSADVDFFLEHWGSEIYGKDVHGHHFWLERVTTIHAPEILGKFDDEHMKDTRSVLMEALEVHKGNAVASCVNTPHKHIYVMDLAGVTFGHFSSAVKRVVKNVIVEMGNLYPESVHKMFFVNAPFVFRAIWGMITPWLHPVTKEKTYILGGGEKLLKEFEAAGIPRSSVPKSLGGEADPTTLKSLILNWRENGAPVATPKITPTEAPAEAPTKNEEKVVEGDA
ncbi:hypothetical protein TL16_g06359 [Triparma laevis f. inornata]|uniref:CRAL-TRIO domain-containing protein n=1 Tax=Triparma laevis f. inornata TaxID=1714386 RepID=A0A9W7AS20_9STRA|nr:hypothetical protein TL16_g06359 [Triparma laevis f. inornata]